MKLYAFYPDGYGLRSFFVVADSETDARKQVDEYVKQRYMTTTNTGKPCLKYEASEWPEDYELKVFDVGQVAESY